MTGLYRIDNVPLAKLAEVVAGLAELRVNFIATPDDKDAETWTIEVRP